MMTDPADVANSLGFATGKSSEARAISALLFIGASTNVMDVYSALNSSPWTAENFGADPAKAASCKEYVWHAIGFSSVYCALASMLAGSWWPIIGGVIADGYMYWLYNRALKRGAAAGSNGWQNG